VTETTGEAHNYLTLMEH